MPAPITTTGRPVLSIPIAWPAMMLVAWPVVEARAMVRTGQKLELAPISGVVVAVKPGDTATLHFETAGTDPGIYFIRVQADGGGISSIARIALLAESATYTVNPSAQMPDGPEKRAALAGPSSLPATRTEPARTSDDPVWVFTLKTALPRRR